MRSIEPKGLLELWTQLGIESGDLVMCHSFLPSLGRPKPGPEIVVSSLLEALGSGGTLVVPAFTFSFFDGEVYDHEMSASKVGILGDLVRTRPDSVRSPDPLYSMTAIGPLAGELMERDSPYCFGSGSIYDKLVGAGMKILMIGVDYTAVSLFMHIEKVCSVDYRYDKLFEGTSRRDGRTYSDEAYHFVRDLERDPECDRNRISDELDKDPSCRVVDFAYGTHRIIDAEAMCRVASEALRQDPNALIAWPV